MAASQGKAQQQSAWPIPCKAFKLRFGAHLLMLTSEARTTYTHIGVPSHIQGAFCIMTLPPEVSRRQAVGRLAWE